MPCNTEGVTLIIYIFYVAIWAINLAGSELEQAL